MARSLIVAVIVEIVLDLAAVLYTIATRNRVAIPGALVRTLIMAILGFLAVRRNSSLARRFMAGLQYATAACGGVLAFFTVPGGQPRLEPVGLAIFVIYTLLGIMTALGSGERETGASADSATP